MNPVSIFLRLLSVVCCLAFSGFITLPARADAMGPASKRTALTISEVMYHPPTRADGKNLEFVEIYNSENVPLDLSNYRIDGDVSFTFPTNTTIAGLGFVVVGAVPTDVQSVYGLTTVFGPFENGGALPNDSGKIELWSRSGALLLEVEYNDSAPWPVAADGSGHSMVLARPTFGQNNAKAWAASWLKGGSPGVVEPAGGDAYSPVVINEILAHTDDPAVDYIELYNHSNSAVDLTGCILTDDLATNKFVIGSVSIPAHGYVFFTQTDLGFSLSAAGETIYLKNPADTRVIDAIRFGAQENGVSFGRFPNGGPEWYRLATQTPGAANDAIRPSQIVINEIMYSPMSGDADDQYVELYNSGATTVNLAGWRLGGGIGFEFPTGTTLAADSYLVIANNATRLISRYTNNLSTNNTLGNFSGKLSGSGERITLTMPDTVVSTNASNIVETNLIHIAVDEVTYQSGGRWAGLADGGGSSLELIDPRADRRQAANWAASDESEKAPWTIVEHTGVLDNGTGSADQLQVHLQGEGECLIDDIEVIPNGGANLIANSSFETDAAGWIAQGTQDQSSLETTEGYNSAKSYHVRAVDRGDTGANRIRYTLTSALTVGSTATIRAKVRWLRGHPEILFRLRGNYLEAIGQLNVPTNLGTPGAKNSRAVVNAGPAIYDVIHSPVLPVANQAFTVTARVNDPDAPVAMQLNYRVDPATTFTSVAMNDTGTLGDAIAGDGIYTGQIPAQASGAMVAFYVRATDSRGAATLFPNNAPNRECYARVGETQPSGSLGTYRMWMSAATVSKWSSRGPLNNSPLDVTFVYNNERVIYNMEALYAGSPYIAPGYNGPTGGLCGYTGEFPKDDVFLGVNDFVLDWPGRDNAAISENISFWIADECDLPNSHRRFIHLHVNGATSNSRGSVYEDVQQPGGDIIKEWSAADTDGHFYKVERWFEFNDSVGLLSDPMPHLENYVTTGGAKKLARYRWNFLPRAVNGSVNDYDDIFALVDAVNATSPEPYTSQTEALVDIERFMGIFAMERVINNFDSWGHQIGKNMYIYKPVDGRWINFMFDNDWLMIPSQGSYGVTAALFTPCEDPVVARMYNHPPFRRAFLRTIKRAAAAMAPEKINPLMDAKYAALTSSGVTRSAGQTLVAPTAVKTWVSGRRNFLISQIDAVAAPFAITTNGGADFQTTTNVVALAGTAPIDVVKIVVNGILYPVQWTTVTNWTIQVPLSAASTRFVVAGVDRDGAAIAGASAAVTVTFQGTIEAPEGRVVFNEIMYHPAVSGGSFIEIRSLAQSTTYDLSNWRIEGAGFTFAPGTILPPGGYLVVAKDRAVFAATYGTSIPLAGEFGGQLQNDSETLWLIKPGATPAQDSVIDQVTYSDQAPWPSNADGLGASLQLIDAAQDNTRAFNWAASTPSTNSEPAQTLITISDVWKYDQTGTDLGTAWIDSSYNDSAWPSGAALLYVETSALPAPKNTALTLGKTTYYFRRHFNFTGDPTKVKLNLSTVIDDGAVFYLNGHGLHRIGMDDPISFGGFSSRLIDNAAFEGPFDVPTTWLKQGDNVLGVEVHQANAGSSDIVFGMTLNSGPKSNPIATPGIANSVTRALPAFPAVWINELQPVNISGPTDEAGQHDPWVELYNAGATPVSLNGWYLSDSVTNLTRWAFPSTASIQPGQRVLVWLDAQAGTTQLHASFRAAAQSGTLALIGPFDGAPTVLDYVNYSGVPNDRSIGRYPDGDNLGFELFFKSTPGAANDNSSPTLPLFINEWMASNSTIPDPTDGHFDDWFELYNPNNVAVDLTGYMLTDNLADPRERYTIPNGWSIGPGQFMLIWADGDVPLNPTQLHVPFKLDRLGENIGLFAPNGALIDSITFGSQTNNISQGRSPDGGADLQFFTKATPGASNVPSFKLNTATLDQAGNVSIVWQTQVGQTYRIQYKTNLSDATWNDFPDVIATSTTLEKLESITPDATRFYRILKVAP
jgi:hypothetical protein